MKIDYATEVNVETLVQFMHDLWPDAPIEELQMEVKLGLTSKKCIISLHQMNMGGSWFLSVQFPA